MRDEPADFVQRYERALATRDWAQVDPLMHDDICVVFSTGAVHRGRDAVRAAFEANFAAIKSEQYEIHHVRWLAEQDNQAVFRFDFRWRGLIDGQETSGAGAGMSVLVKEAGRWKLLVENLGLTPSARG